MRTSWHLGFTLVEVLVVVAIIGVLVALLLPAVQRIRDAGYRVECENHLKQSGLALQHYHDTHSALPPGCSYQNGADPYQHMSWCTRLLPYLDQQALWQTTLDAFAEDPFFRDNPPHTGLSTVLPVFTCPSDPRTLTAANMGRFQVAFTAYLGLEGLD